MTAIERLVDLVHSRRTADISRELAAAAFKQTRRRRVRELAAAGLVRLGDYLLVPLPPPAAGNVSAVIDGTTWPPRFSHVRWSSPHSYEELRRLAALGRELPSQAYLHADWTARTTVAPEQTEPDSTPGRGAEVRATIERITLNSRIEQERRLMAERSAPCCRQCGAAGAETDGLCRPCAELNRRHQEQRAAEKLRQAQEWAAEQARIEALEFCRRQGRLARRRHWRRVRQAAGWLWHQTWHRRRPFGLGWAGCLWCERAAASSRRQREIERAAARLRAAGLRLTPPRILEEIERR